MESIIATTGLEHGVLPSSIGSLPSNGLGITEQLPNSQHVASEFESVFLSLMLKELRGTLQEGGFFGEEGSDTFGGMFDLFLGQHLAKAAPLGIGELVLDSYASASSSENSETISIKA